MKRRSPKFSFHSHFVEFFVNVNVKVNEAFHRMAPAERGPTEATGWNVL